MDIHNIIIFYFLVGALISVMAEYKERKRFDEMGLDSEEPVFITGFVLIILTTFWPAFILWLLYEKAWKKGRGKRL